jgi:hypothetical protein
MAHFNNAITENGRLMLARAQSGAVLIPTRIVIGSGNLPAGQTPATMTAVVTPVKELPINKKQAMPDGKCVIGGVYNNADVSTAFYFRELAVFMRAEYRAEDGTVTQEVEEVLYSYGNAGSTADYMPAYSTSTVVEKQIDLVIWVGHEAQVDLSIESGVYLTQEQGVLNLKHINPETTGFASLLEYMGSIYDRNIIVSGHISGFSDMPDGVSVLHGTINVVGGQLTVSGNARTAYYYRGTNSITEWTHEWRKVYDTVNIPTLDVLGAAPGGYGLGGQSKFLNKTDNLNNIIKNGWYSWHEDTPANAPAAWGNMIVTSQQGHYTQTVVLFAHLGCVLQRTGVGDHWSEWEWVNPPFEIGTEYRTTERRDGIAVYKMLGADGVLKYHLEGGTSWIPCAQENGAVKKTGDTMSDVLTIEKTAGPAVHIIEKNGAGGALQLWNNVLSLSNKNSVDDLNNYRLLSLANAKSEADIVHALVLSDVTNGVQKYYTVLHSGNMAAFGLGAVPASVE